MDDAPLSRAPLRERGKARRVSEIVAAAADLWRYHGIDRISLNQIAAKAEVAPQTIYNLIGGLDAIGFAVIKLALETMDATLREAPATGIDLALRSARICVGLYTADALLYRQVLVRVPKALFDGTHLGRDTADTAIRAMIDAQKIGEIRDDVDPERLGRTIYVSYLGTLYDWACGDSSDADFLRAAEVAVLAPATACATDAARPALTARLLAAMRSDGDTMAVGNS